jgi:hypothetical protein
MRRIGRGRKIDPGLGPGVLDLESDRPERVRADQVGVTAHDVAVDVFGDDQRDLRTRAGQRALERPGLEHAEQEIDVAADEPVPVVVDRADVSSDAELKTSRGAADVIMVTDEAAEPFGQRVDDSLARDSGRDRDQHAVAAVLVKALSPGNTGTVERLGDQPVKLFVQVTADDVVAVRPGEPGDIDGQQGAYLTVGRRRRRSAGRAAHRAATGVVSAQPVMSSRACNSSSAGHDAFPGASRRSIAADSLARGMPETLMSSIVRLLRVGEQGGPPDWFRGILIATVGHGIAGGPLVFGLIIDRQRAIRPYDQAETTITAIRRCRCRRSPASPYATVPHTRVMRLAGATRSDRITTRLAAV